MNRRLFLRSAAATLWLPFLRSAPGAAAPTAPIRRAVWFFVPNGLLVEALTPDRTGPGYALPTPLAGLAPIRERVTIVSGLRNQALAATEASGYGTHESCVASLLTDVPLAPDYYTTEARLGVSVDQYAVQQLRPPTPYASLQLASGEPWIPAPGTVNLFYNALSWANDATPLTALVDPRAVFDRMFAGADAAATAEEQARRMAARRSVLDAVHDRAKRLSTALDAEDRARLDQYTTAVRDLERRIEGLASAGAGCDPGDPPDPNLAFPDRLDAMFDLTRVALTCDLTRVATLMAATTTALTTFPWLGIGTDHHSLSHNFAYSEPDRVDYLRVQAFFVERFAAFCTALAEVPADEGDLLSSTLVSLVSEFGEGNLHLSSPMMMLAAGGEAGGLRHGRHLDAGDVPHANYLRAALAFQGVDPEGFGRHATGTLDLT